MKNKIILDVFAGLLILLFIYTGLFKILTPGIMEMDLHKAEQPKILQALATPLAYLIPLTELIVAALLFFPKYRKLGYYGSFVLMTIFTLYVGYILFFFHGVERPCTCGGIFRELSWKSHFIVNLLYMAIAMVGIILESKKPEQRKEDDQIDKIRYSISQ